MEDNTNLPAMVDMDKEIIDKISQKTSAEDLRNITQLFNIAQAKKDMLRSLKYGDLLDKVVDQMGERLTKRPGEFSNSDLTTYLQVLQNASEKARKLSTTVEEMPAIQLTQNNVNIGTEHGALSRDSRGRVTDAVKAILSKFPEVGKEQLSNDDTNESDESSLE